MLVVQINLLIMLIYTWKQKTLLKKNDFARYILHGYSRACDPLHYPKKAIKVFSICKISCIAGKFLGLHGKMFY